ncbi:hypothetical protein AB0F43_31580 [Kribbella sp. NPDC023972]|uniref:hypothetical protein n=1 Tax=Kribbella sp. NPDC023972 TaxID=3154795 RepID=UPI0033E53E82
MVTDEEVQQVTDAATNYVLMFPDPAARPCINGQLVRNHVAATLRYLAAETERLGVYETYDDLIHYIAEQAEPPSIEATTHDAT